MAPFEERLWDRIARGAPNVCWEWRGTKISGYGYIYVDRHTRVRAHRIVYQLTNGPIPAGLVVRHKCDNPACCNPSHLLLGTAADNNRDAIERNRGSASCRRFFGVDHGKAKLTDEAVIAIRDSKDTIRALATAHGVSEGHIRNIRCG